MKIVWLVNTILPQIAEAEGIQRANTGGWTYELSGLLSADSGLELTVLYPRKEGTAKKTGADEKIVIGKAGNIRYAGFSEPAIAELSYNREREESFRGILREIRPDVVHIWGTEYGHTLEMLRACEDPKTAVISLQGIISVIGERYTALLPEDVIHRHTLRDLIRRDSIYEQQQKFLKRGELELDALREAVNVIGRTEWDRDTVTKINPSLRYHHCRELLRKEFYTGESWEYSRCRRHSIFMSQSYYPVKGFHIALRILRELKKTFPDVTLTAAGKSLTAAGFREKLKQDSYSRYICDRIREYGLEENVQFAGPLDTDGMKERYLSANVYLQASVMENSSNALGEAMILGVPCVASNVGGTSSMLRDGTDGFLYPFDEPDRAAELIARIFEEEDKVSDMCFSARETARSLYDREQAYSEYLGVYQKTLWNCFGN